MCLSRIRETYDSPSTLIVDGWKAFRQKNGVLEFENFGVGGQGGQMGVPLDQWIQASAGDAPRGITASDGKNYIPGFHVYSDEQQISKNRSTFQRVYVRRVTCLGDQGTMATVIAQEMYVPSDQNAWPPLPEPSAPAPTAPKKRGIIDRIKKKRS